MPKIVVSQMPTRGPRKGTMILLLLSAVSLAGCGASLNGETVSSFSPKEHAASAAMASNGTESENGSTRVAQPADAFTSVNTPGSVAYKIGPLDVLDVSVFKVPELSKSVQVAATGTVNLPLVGEIPAAGRTAQEMERDLTVRLGAKYVQKPQVTVYIKEYNSQRVTIEGAVKKPGVYPVKGKTSLLQFIAMAEGLDPNADSTVVVFRHSDGNRLAARFDVSDIRTGRAQDPAVQSGDVIVVGTSAVKEGFNNFLKILPAAGVFAILL